MVLGGTDGDLGGPRLLLAALMGTWWHRVTAMGTR